MKKTVFACLALLLTVMLIAAVPAARADAIEVHTVDELIAAVAPGAEIHMAEGTYLLSQSASYGGRTGNPYIKWEELWGSYILSIHDVDGLVITGSGRDCTELIADDPMSDVLQIDCCTNVTLSGITAGHTPQAEGCAAGVLMVKRSENVVLSQLGLFGCGAVGVTAERTDLLTVSECDIYDCSSNGLQLNECTDVSVSDCSIRNIGKRDSGWNSGYAVFGINQTRGVSICRSSVESCMVQCLLTAWDSHNILLSENYIAQNSAIGEMFQLINSEAVIESSNVFEKNTFSRWYGEDWGGIPSDYAFNEWGEDQFTQDPDPLHGSGEPVDAIPVISGEQKQVRVDTVDAFLAAIGSNTEIVLTGDLYDLSAASTYGGAAANGFYYWEETFDGFQLVIVGAENLSIVSEDNQAEAHTISALPRYADVITFRGCTNVMLQGFTAGHTVEPGVCAGGVLTFESGTKNALVNNCRLYGCGILGVKAYNMENLQVVNSCIYECSDGGIQCFECEGVTVGGCSFWDLGGSIFQIEGCSNVVIEGTELLGSYYGN